MRHSGPPTITPKAAVSASDDRLARAAASAAGVAGAAVALGIGELGSGFSRAVPSLVVAMGDVVVDASPGDATEVAIDAVGTADKPLLLAGVVVLSLVIGAVVGRFAWRRRAVAPMVFAAFGVAGAIAASRAPFASTVWASTAALVAAAIGAATTLGLLRLVGPPRAEPPRAEPPRAEPARDEPPRAEPMTRPAFGAADRRVFLLGTAGAAVVALSGSGIGRVLRESRAATAAAASRVPLPPLRAGAVDPLTGIETIADVPGLSSYLTPLSGPNRFYRIDTALQIPEIDAREWTLDIGGLVQRPYRLTYDDILAMPLEDRVITLSCVSNEVGGPLVGTARWTGVPLTALLDRAGVDPRGVQVVGRSVDGFTAGFPTSVLADGRSALLVVGMDGEPLSPRHGFPARLVIAGLYGYVSAVKWLKEIRIETADFDGYWIPRGWAKNAPAKIMSRIDVPRGAATIDAGRTMIAGVAWAPTAGIERVEVQVDLDDWVTARLSGSPSGESWVQWAVPWQATSGRHQIRVRAIGRDGVVQPGFAVDPAPDGAEGWHLINVRVR